MKYLLLLALVVTSTRGFTDDLSACGEFGQVEGGGITFSKSDDGKYESAIHYGGMMGGTQPFKTLTVQKSMEGEKCITALHIENRWGDSLDMEFDVAAGTSKVTQYHLKQLPMWLLDLKVNYEMAQEKKNKTKKGASSNQEGKSPTVQDNIFSISCQLTDDFKKELSCF